MSDNDSLTAHVAFTTTVAPAQPTPIREYRGAVARNAALVGRYLVTLTDPIANEDLECVATIDDGPTWCDVKAVPTADAGIWEVITFGGGVGADIGLLNLAGATVRLSFNRVHPG